MKITKTSIIPLLIIFAGLMVRIVHIRQPLLEFFPQRQTQTAEITRNIYKNGWPDFWTPKVRYFTKFPIPYVLEFPLYNGIVATLYHLFGPNVLWGRIVSLVFFVLSGIVFFRLVQTTINNQQLTIFALIFFVFSPLHILISRSFQPEELVLFLLFLAIYKKSWLIFSLAVLTKLPIALFAPVVFYTSRHPEAATGGRRTPSRFFASLRMTASLFLAALWYYRASKLTVHPAIVRNFDLSNWFQPQLWLQPRWYFSLFQIEHIWSLTTLGLLFFWLGFWVKVSERKIDLWFVWLTSGLFYLAIFNYHAMTHEYYHLFLLPPLSIFVGIGLNQILEVSKGFSKNIRTISAVGILLLFILGLIQSSIKKIISSPKSPEESKEITADRYRLIEDF